MSKRLTTEEFIEKAKSVHGDKYDYTDTVYINTRNKIKIYCNIHNEYFYQLAHSHLQGRGCVKCGKEVFKEKKTLTTKQFIKNAIQIFSSIVISFKTPSKPRI